MLTAAFCVDTRSTLPSNCADRPSHIMRKLIFYLHLYLALIAAAFVILMGLTGSIMAFEPEIDRLLHRKLVDVTPGAHALSFSEISAIVAEAFPGERIEGYFPSN